MPVPAFDGRVVDVVTMQPIDLETPNPAGSRFLAGFQNHL
jgi:hypothetical protein